jgi:hypothetical protein
VNERQHIGIIANSSVADHKADIPGLEERVRGFGHAFQDAAYQLMLRANNFPPHTTPPTQALRNKIPIDRTQLRHDNGTVGIDLHEGETAHQLWLPHNGIEHIFPERPVTESEVTRRLFQPPTIGGNVANVGLNQLVMAEALQPVLPKLTLDFYVPEHGVLRGVLEEIHDRVNGLVHVHGLPDIHERFGLHIPLRFLHEGDRMQTLMLNRRGAAAEAVNAMLRDGTDVTRQEFVRVFATDYLPVLYGSPVSLLPTSASIDRLPLQTNQALLVSGSELRRILASQGHTFPPAHEQNILPAIAHQGAEIQIAHQQLVNARGRALHSSLQPKHPGRLAQIGLEDGRSVDMYVAGNDLIIAEHTQPHDDGIDAMIHAANSPHVGRHLEETTGRGDAASAATLLDLAEPTKLLAWWKQDAVGSYPNLSDEQVRSLQFVLPGVMSRLHAKLVQYCLDSNFGQALTAEQYQNVLRFGMHIALQNIAAFDRPVGTHINTAFHAASGIATSIWKMPLR